MILIDFACVLTPFTLLPFFLLLLLSMNFKSMISVYSGIDYMQSIFVFLAKKILWLWGHQRNCTLRPEQTWNLSAKELPCLFPHLLGFRFTHIINFIEWIMQFSIKYYENMNFLFKTRFWVHWVTGPWAGPHWFGIPACPLSCKIWAAFIWLDHLHPRTVLRGLFVATPAC